jgi:chromosome segregation ATPase
VASSEGQAVVTALQTNLQQQLTLKAEAENRARIAEAKVQQLEQTAALHQTEHVAELEALQQNLQQQMTIRAEAEHKARSAYDRVNELESDKERNLEDLKSLHQQLARTQEKLASQSNVMDQLRMDRNDHEQRAMALTSRLNALAKKDAVKVNTVEELEEDLTAAREALDRTKKALSQALAENTTLTQKLAHTEMSYKEHIKQMDGVVLAQKQINEERKSKMKAFVDAKAEELRQAKEDNDSLQLEVSQTNRSLVELNNRWKQLHTQWVQAQTRNRELQRDLNRTKKDSENLHKQGDSLEMKLSRSANETEEHKHKRLAAKNELMSVLRTLDMERDVTAKLRDKIKFTLTPQLQSHHQVLSECLDEFEACLQKLSLRLGKPVPPLPLTELDESSDNEPSAASGHNDGLLLLNGSASHYEIGTLVEKLEQENRRVTQAVATVASHMERLLWLVRSSGERTCFTALSELVTTGVGGALVHGDPSHAAVTAALPRTAALAQALPTLGRSSHRYGQVPGMTDHA